MPLDCVITIKGSGVKNKNNASRPAENRTGPVSQFLILHMGGVYTDVYNHVKACQKCDPEEVIRGYIQGRLIPKFFDETSAGLISLAFKYDKKMPGKINRRTLAEMIWRNGSVNSLVPYERVLNLSEVALGLQQIWKRWNREDSGQDTRSRWWMDSIKENTMDSSYRLSILELATRFKKKLPFPDLEELEKELLVSYVMGS